MTVTELDRAQAVEKATSLFWTKGYVETSVEDIVRATGLNRYALYNSFGGKREMLLEALARFHGQRMKSVQGLFEDPSMLPWQAMRHMFVALIEEVLNSGNGCLMCNTVSEIAPKDEAVARVCNVYSAEFVDLIGAKLRHAQADGALRPDLDPEEVARLLLIFKIGLATLAKAGAPRGILLNAVDSQVAALSS